MTVTATRLERLVVACLNASKWEGGNAACIAADVVNLARLLEREMNKLPECESKTLLDDVLKPAIELNAAPRIAKFRHELARAIEECVRVNRFKVANEDATRCYFKDHEFDMVAADIADTLGQHEIYPDDFPTCNSQRIIMTRRQFEIFLARAWRSRPLAEWESEVSVNDMVKKLCAALEHAVNE